MNSHEPIAIIGTGCRLPGASSSPSRLWDLLSKPRDVASKVPADRFNIDQFYHPNGLHHGSTNTQEAYFLTEDVRSFDAGFFNISASEAESIDPQQRLLLETVYEAMERSGQTIRQLQGSSTGVFCGVFCDDYNKMLFRDPDELPRYTATGATRAIASNRISYFFDWRGPSVSIDTACSSSLVAVHMAVQSLVTGECRSAVAAGSNLILTPDMHMMFSKLNMMSPAGRVRMWDADADGYARGEGVAALILKRLSDAIADGDPIDCVIRASGVNQDGRSPGLTMPSSVAQADLIRSTYQKAGLDPRNPVDRCQYFEAHGTGTPVGDPQEALAIHRSFFAESDAESPMYVGSIKTLIGHTESTAGIAGLLKASLSIQHGLIPPNLHFKSLNPKIAPYSASLVVPTRAQTWPSLPAGVPRRASVNSFGFGGTNAHVIIEGYGSSRDSESQDEPSLVVLPFVFSATSEKTLGVVLESYLQFLRLHSQIDLNDLAWSLFRHRSDFAYRLSIIVSSLDDLKAKIEAEIELRKERKPSTIVSRPKPAHRILGVFTGQGAQWPEMGCELIWKSPQVRAWVLELQTSLDTLPAQYRPNFSLIEELSSPAGSTRVYEARLSQPLCATVQIVLVKLLRSLGISFSAIVGHSSGEVAAAYAAGYLSASDAIRVAHLRGHFTKLAGVDGHKGGMLAAGLSMDEAKELCNRPELEGRIVLAAVNSPSSVTLSGNIDAVREADSLLKSEKKFSRPLQVDIGYHSFHMMPCAEPWLRALEECNIQPRSSPSCAWFSSVPGYANITPTKSDVLKKQYWVDNLTSPVHFAPALSAALSEGPFGMIIEVGPHPALKGPALQTLSSISEANSRIPYTSPLKRGTGALSTMAAAIGDLWTYLGPDSCNVEGYSWLFSSKKHALVKELPTYPFDHSQTYWAESRATKHFLRPSHFPPNQLLGKPTLDTTELEWRWRNRLVQREVEWLSGHEIQGQAVFPAAGYLAMALEAAHVIAGEEPLRLVEIGDCIIDRALQISDNATGVGTLFSMGLTKSDSHSFHGSFTCFDDGNGSFQNCASGTITSTFGETNATAIPSRACKATQGMVEVDVDEFYSALDELGHAYSGSFRGITSLARKRWASSGLVLNQQTSRLHSPRPIILHPSLLETAVQALLAAIGAPGDGQLYSLHIPTGVSRVWISSSVYQCSMEPTLAFDATISEAGPEGFRGDAALFDMDGNGLVQFEGICLSPLIPPSPADDRLLFSRSVWGPFQPGTAVSYPEIHEDFKNQCTILERAALFHIRTLSGNLTVQDRTTLESHQKLFMAWIDQVLESTMSAQHPTCQPNWLIDDENTIHQLLEQLPQTVDKECMMVIGSNLPRYFRGETSVQQELQKEELLARFQKESTDFHHHQVILGDITREISFRYPGLRILEIGCLPGSVAQKIKERIGAIDHSYTFVDAKLISTHDKSNGQGTNGVVSPDNDFADQGLSDRGYDVVIMSNIQQAPDSLQKTFLRVRRLLKQGGYLLSMGRTNPQPIRVSTILGGFQNFWATPSIGHVGEHDSVLKQAGFSGVDNVISHPEALLKPISILVSQAIDDNFNMLRNPLLCPPNAASRIPTMLLVGGLTAATRPLITALTGLLNPYFGQIEHSTSLETWDWNKRAPDIALLLADLDGPSFQTINGKRLEAFKHLLTGQVLWVTAGEETPFHGTSQGLLRGLASDNSDSRYQHIHFDAASAVEAPVLAAAFLRFAHDGISESPDYLWSRERELRLQNGVMKIHRVLNEESMNSRYMAKRRIVHQEINPRKAKVNVIDKGGKLEVVSAGMLPATNRHGAAGNIELRVEYSTRDAIRVQDDGFFYLVVGSQINGKGQFIAFAQELASVISVNVSWAAPFDATREDIPGFLSSVRYCLAAIDMVNRTTPGTTLWIHEPDEVLRKAVTAQAGKRDISTFFSSTHRQAHARDVSMLHEASPSRVLKAQLPRNISVFANMDPSAERFATRLERLLPPDIVLQTSNGIFRSNSTMYKKENAHETADSLIRSIELARSIEKQRVIDHVVAHPLSDLSADTGAIDLLDWTTAGPLPIKVQPASSQITLSPSKTYVLVGMETHFAQSICEWMVANGARHIVLACQRPKTEDWWLDEMSSLGAKVIIMTLDLSDPKSLGQLHSTIAAQMLPVGGLVNGALPHIDADLQEMSLEALKIALEPIIQGCIYFDKTYSCPDLEFFILMGSSIGSSGHPSHAAHCASTAFMSSLIHQRQKRGQVGSIIHSSAMSQAAHGTCKGAAHSDSLGLMRMSDNDIHEVFAEAILAGRAGNAGGDAEIFAGIAHVTFQDQNTLKGRDPSLWHFTHYDTGSSAASASKGISLQELLRSASQSQESFALLENTLISQLRQRMGVSAEEAVTSDTQLVELGVDSLVAVDLRTWFAKDLSVDIAVLKILGGLSIGDLINHAVESSGAAAQDASVQDQRIAGSDRQPEASASTCNGLAKAEVPRAQEVSSRMVNGFSSEKSRYERIEQLSFAQSRYWFLNQYLEDKTSPNISLLLRINGNLRVTDLEAAVSKVGARHQSLRTCYLAETDDRKNASQAVLRQSHYHLEKCDVEKESQAKEVYTQFCQHPYKLEEGEVARICLVKTAGGAQFLVLGWHHIAMDGGSFHSLWHELGLAYTKQRLPPLPRQYIDFSVAQRSAYERGAMSKELAFWRSEFDDFPEPLPLLPMACTRSRQVLQSYDLEELKWEIPPTTMAKIRASSRKHRASPFHFFLATLRAFLVRLTNTEDICIGIADANRFDDTNARTVGFLLNLLPLRFRSTDVNHAFSEILTDTCKRAFRALENANMPFDRLLDELGAPRSAAYSPLFQVLMDWQPQTGDNYELGDLKLTNEGFLAGKTAYDLTLLIAEAANGGAIIRFRGQKSLYNQRGIELVARGFSNLIEAVATDTLVKVYDAPLYQLEAQEAINVGKGPTLGSQWPSTISRKIEQVAAQYSEKTAVKDTDGREFTYSELSRRIDIVAHALLQFDVTTGAPVCLFMNPTADWLCCMLAIWKLNLVYVPLDLRNPVPRLATMVADCCPQVILFQEDTELNVEALGCPTAHTLNISNLSFRGKVASMADRSSPEARAVILYTSGSTGRPKGIQLRHSSLRNQVEGYTTRWQLHEEVVLQQGAMTFNHSLDQMMTGLTTGGRVIVVSRSMRGDPLSLTRLVADEDITYTKATPAEYTMWLRYGSDSLRRASSWRFAFGGGEHLTTSLARGFRALELPRLRLFNSYGPGEITISSHKREIDYRQEKSTPGNIYPCGYSLPNYHTYIVDKDMKSLPQGVSGEVLIGGAGPALGYLDLDELNQEKFIENPFTTPEYRSQGWTRAYRTSDRGHLLADGSLVIEGRLDGDTQVKIRGIRIELEEIDNAILEAAQGALSRAIVCLHGEENQFLTAHVVMHSDFNGDVPIFLKQLREGLPLPQYMCPSTMIPVNELPLNVHGKVDRKAVAKLPLPKAQKANGISASALTPIESRLRNVWADVLNEGFADMSSADRGTCFFQVGGSSVLLVKLQLAIREATGVNLRLVDLFENSTLGAMATVVEANQSTQQIIDWAAETSLPGEFEIQQSVPSAEARKTSDLTVVFTGATGYLGKLLLAALVSNPSVAHVHAVAVRPRGDNTGGRTLPPQSHKLTVHKGDLISPCLGLDPSVFATLSATADLIIHSGANRSFWDPYPLMRDSNVSSTKTLVQLAGPRHIPIHYMSSGGVTNIPEDGTPSIQHGYVATKWASERVLQQAAKRFALPVVVHRPTKGVDLPKAPDTLREAFRRCSEKMRCRPVDGGWKATMAFTPAAPLAEALATQMLASSAKDQVSDCVRIKEHPGMASMSTDEMVEAASGVNGEFDQFDTLPLARWMGRTKRELGWPWFVTAQDSRAGGEQGVESQL